MSYILDRNEYDAGEFELDDHVSFLYNGERLWGTVVRVYNGERLWGTVVRVYNTRKLYHVLVGSTRYEVRPYDDDMRIA